MGTEENPNLPQKSEYATLDAIPGSPPALLGERKKKAFWKGFFSGVATLASAEVGGALVDRGFEVSGVKPNIVHACLYWFCAWLIFSIILWVWVWALKIIRKVQIGVSLFPLIAFGLIFVIIRPWVIQEYRAEHAPPDTVAADTFKAVKDLAHDVKSTITGPDTLEQVRAMFREINPKILEEIDKGGTRIHVLLTDETAAKISKFTTKNSFLGDYFSIEEGTHMTLSGIGGPFDNYNGILTEVVPNGSFSDWFIVPKTNLRVSK